MRTFFTTTKITSYLSNALSMVLGFFTNHFQKTETPNVLTLSIYKGKGYLKAWVVLLLLGLSGGVMGQTTLMSWDMSTQTSTAASGSLSPGFSNANLASGSGALSRGAGVTPQGLNRAWGGSNWEQTGTANLTSNKNITFNVSPKPGFAISLSSINPYSYRRSTTGPTAAILEATANSVTSGISQGPIAFGNSTPAGADVFPTVTLSGDLFLQDIKGPITFNLSPYGATDANGTLYIWDKANSTASDFSINGSILGSETLSLSGFENCFGFASASQTFALKGDGLSAAAVNLTAPAGFEISTDNISYSGTLSITPSSGSVNNLVYVRIKSTTVVGTYSGDLTIIGGGFTVDADLKVALSGVVNPTPTAAVLSGTATICEGSSTNLAVAITGGTSPFSIVYNDGSGNFAVPVYNSGGNIPVSPISSKTYNLVSVTDMEGCVVASPSGGATVTVNNRPTSGVIAGNATICSGQSTNLTVTIGGGVSPFQVVYSDGSSNTTLSLYTSGSTIAVSPTSSTTYTIVSITDANGCTVASPSGSAVVTVNPTPSSGVLSGTATICSDASTNLGVAITGGTSPFTVVYSGGTINSYISAAAIPVSPASTTTYTLTSVTDANGCTVASPSGSAIVTVNQRPTAATILGTTTICSGLGTSLVVNITDGQSPFTVVHSGGTVSSYISGSPIMITPSATTTYTIVSVTDANGCTVATPTGSAVVTVNPTPVGTNTTLSAICSGTGVGYDLTTNVAVNSTYSWVASTPPPFITGASTTAQSGSTITNTLSNNDIMGNVNVVYTVTPTSVVGTCLGSAFTITVPVKVNLIAQLNGSASNSSIGICSGASTNLDFFSLPFLGAASIDYSDGSNTFTVSLPSGGIVTESVSPTSTTTYTLQSITANGCTKTLTGPSRTITVNPLPTGTLSATETSGTTSNDNIICSGDAVTFTAPSGYSTYNFKVNGLSDQSGPSNTYTASFSGDVIVEVEITSASSCISTLSGVNITVGSCGVTNVTRSKNYATIQQAIDHSSTQNGDEITVAAGNYGPITITKSLILKGANFGKTCTDLRNAESIITGITGAVYIVAIGTSGVTFEGFEINANSLNSKYAISTAGGLRSDIVIRNNRIIVSGPEGLHGIRARDINGLLTIEDNCILVNNQLTTSQLPTSGILITNISGTTAASVRNNDITGGFYGYIAHNVNTTTQTIIENGALTGQMQGVAIVNTLTGAAPLAPSNIKVKGLNMSGFTGNHSAPGLAPLNHHAGIYTFTAGASTATEALTVDIDGVTIDGTGKPNQASAGIYLGDFATGSGTFQTVTVSNSTIQNNINRGVSARGKVSATITNSDILNNGADAFGSGGNDGFGIIALEGATVNVSNSNIVQPTSSITPVTALMTGNGTSNSIVAHDNSITNPGNNAQARAAYLTAGTGTIDATCNWWGGIAGAVSPQIAGAVTYEFFRTSGTDTDGSAIGFVPASGTCNGCSSGNLVTNTSTGEIFCTIQAAIDDAQTLATHTIEVASGTYNEQVLVNKGLNIKGVGATKPIINFTGIVSGKPTLFDVSADGATIDNLNFKVDLSKLKSAIIASAAGIDNIIVKDNLIESYATPSSGTYGDRNAVSVNYTGNTNYRVATGGVNNVTFIGNIVTGTAPDSYFRSGISLDEGGLTATGNNLTSINHDILLRFASNGANTISNNTFSGGGVELSDQNAGSGTITVSNNIFTGAGALGTAKLRLKNNYDNIAHLISNNTFNTFDWGVSVENMRNVTFNGNTFTGDAATDRHVVVNTKSISSNSNIITQVAVGAVITNNSFAGQGIGLTFQNHDSDNDSYGTFTLGSAGNENNFEASLNSYISFDGQTGTSTSSTFPTYPGTGDWPTTMACWTLDLNAGNNKFDLGAGLQLPSTMNLAERTQLEIKLTHKPDNACLGNIKYYFPIHNETQDTIILAFRKQ
jgi:PKD-like domain